MAGGGGEGEGIVPTKHEKIMVLRGDGMPYQEMEGMLSELAVKAKAHDAQGIKEVLKKIIPEYVPDFKAASTVGSYINARELRN